MVLNHDQRIYSKLYIRNVMRMLLKDAELQKAVEILDNLLNTYRMRMEIYYNLKYELEENFPDIEKMVFYGIVLKDIYNFFQHDLDHLDMFVPTDIDHNEANGFKFIRTTNDDGKLVIRIYNDKMRLLSEIVE